MDAHDLNIDPTAWWWILLAGIAFIVGGLAVALNRIQERRPPGWKDATIAPGPEGAGKSWIKDLGKWETRKVMDPNGPFPRCVPMVMAEGVCRNCFRPIDDESPKACPASNPMDRFRLEWGVETMLRSDAKEKD